MKLVSTDHKVIGIQYGLTSLAFLRVGFVLVLIIRWQHAYPGLPMPLIGGWLGENAPGGILLPEFYNQLGAMHGTIMVFLGVVPLAVGAFGNYVLPLQLGAPDMAFPRLNLLSYWLIRRMARPRGGALAVTRHLHCQEQHEAASALDTSDFVLFVSSCCSYIVGLKVAVALAGV